MSSAMRKGVDIHGGTCRSVCGCEGNSELSAQEPLGEHWGNGSSVAISTAVCEEGAAEACGPPGRKRVCTLSGRSALVTRLPFRCEPNNGEEAVEVSERVISAFPSDNSGDGCARSEPTKRELFSGGEGRVLSKGIFGPEAETETELGTSGTRCPLCAWVRTKEDFSVCFPPFWPTGRKLPPFPAFPLLPALGFALGEGVVRDPVKLLASCSGRAASQDGSELAELRRERRSSTPCTLRAILPEVAERTSPLRRIDLGGSCAPCVSEGVAPVDPRWFEEGKEREDDVDGTGIGAVVGEMAMSSLAGEATKTDAPGRATSVCVSGDRGCRLEDARPSGLCWFRSPFSPTSDCMGIIKPSLLPPARIRGRSDRFFSPEKASRDGPDGRRRGRELGVETGTGEVASFMRGEGEAQNSGVGSTALSSLGPRRDVGWQRSGKLGSSENAVDKSF